MNCKFPAKVFANTQENDSDNSENDPNELYQIESESESEPELECEEWDIDCIVLPKQTSSLIGYHLLPTCSRDPELHPRKKLKISPELNHRFKEIQFMDNLKKNWNENTKFISEDVELIVEPFKVCVINNFLENVKILDDVRQEFYELNWNNRSIDLYEFFQSKDIKYLHPEYIKSIYNYLKNDFIKWVTELTGYELTHISATCSVYTNTDYLLVHDDQREDRILAFILYLTGAEEWSESKGGALQLLDKDASGHPQNVVKSIIPKNNQLVLFPVTNDSYHQVAEITTLSDCRLSINGWFHVKTPSVFNTPPYTPLENSLYSKNSIKASFIDFDLESWINEDYLSPNIKTMIQRYIEENSEISLTNFFKEESFNEILQALNNKDINWIKVGPPNRYCYEIINTRELPHSLERFLMLFQSNVMFHLLQRYTDLEFTLSGASMKFELQKWTPGCYSLLTDYNWQEKNELDVVIYFGVSKSSDVVGARTIYVTIEDEIQHALITLGPRENTLNLIYRDSARFTKYFSKQSKCQCFYKLICSYSE